MKRKLLAIELEFHATGHRKEMIVRTDDLEGTDCFGKLEDPVVLPVLAFGNADRGLDNTAPAGHTTQKRAVGGCLTAGEVEGAAEDSCCSLDQVLT